MTTREPKLAGLMQDSGAVCRGEPFRILCRFHVGHGTSWFGANATASGCRGTALPGATRARRSWCGPR